MMKKFFFIVFFLTLSSISFAQNNFSISINGKLIVENAKVEGVLISNLNTQHSVLSDSVGNFTIDCKLGDTLAISNMLYENTKHKITKQNIQDKTIQIFLVVQNNLLDEVQITKFKKVTTASLGLSPKNPKNYTPAERRLNASTGGITGLINLINGTTSRLKEELEIEKKEFAIVKVSDYYSDTYFFDVLKIEKEKMEGFKFYLVEDKNFVLALNNKNKKLANFLIADIAEDYRKINKE